MKFSIYRYNPETDKKPYMQEYDLDVPEGSDMMLLDALVALKDQDPTLSFRRSCREGVCGSDGMNINGKNGLACITSLSSLKTPIVVRPLPGLPVVRDLVVDMAQFYKQYEKIKPFLIANDEPPAKERLQSRPCQVGWTCVSYVPVVRLPVHHSGGIRTSLLARQVCCKLIAS